MSATTANLLTYPLSVLTFNSLQSFISMKLFYLVKCVIIKSRNSKLKISTGTQKLGINAGCSRYKRWFDLYYTNCHSIIVLIRAVALFFFQFLQILFANQNKLQNTIKKKIFLLFDWLSLCCMRFVTVRKGSWFIRLLHVLLLFYIKYWILLIRDDWISKVTSETFLSTACTRKSNSRSHQYRLVSIWLCISINY